MYTHARRDNTLRARRRPLCTAVSAARTFTVGRSRYNAGWSALEEDCAKNTVRICARLTSWGATDLFDRIQQRQAPARQRSSGPGDVDDHSATNTGEVK